MASTRTEPLARPEGQAVAAQPRLVRGRLSNGHWVVVAAALVAAVLNYAVLRAADDTVEVVVAAVDLVPGQPVEAGAFAVTAVRVDAAQLAGLVPAGELPTVEGSVPTAALRAGDLVRRTDLQPPSAPGARRAMSLPVEPEHAVGGALRPGDRVDVIEVRDGGARYLVVDAEVLAVTSPDLRTGLVGPRGFSVTIAVDDEAALRLAVAVRHGAIEVVRATGATPVRHGAVVAEEDG